MTQESNRQFIHIGLFILAPVIVMLPRVWQTASLVALLVIASICMLIPAIQRQLYRSHEAVLSTGAVSYFLVLIIASLFFAPEIVVASWAVLAFGDGSATLAGSAIKSRQLWWNSNKSIVGFCVFIVAATIVSGAAVAWYTPHSIFSAIKIAAQVALIAAMVESLPWKIDDNIAVGITAAVAFSLLI